MFDPQKSDFDSDVQRSMNMFERAKVGEVAPFVPARVERLLLGLDHSSQDAMGQTVAKGLMERFQCHLDIVDGTENVAGDDRAPSAAKALGCHALAKCSGENFEQLLAAIDTSKCELLIVPSPFQRELEKVGMDSTGTVIDVLLSRSPVPLLVVRQAYELEAQPFAHVILVLIGENEAAADAARWACGMVAPGGRLDLMLVVEEEIFENVQSLMQSLDPEVDISPEKLADALQRSHARLHRACQKSASELGFAYRMKVKQEGDRPLAELSSGSQHPLIVLAHERADHTSQGHVHARIRQSPHPLLIVPQPLR